MFQFYKMLLFVSFIFVLHIDLLAATLELHVAKNGNDSWSGILANPNQDNTNGPFATLERARQFIREHKKKNKGFDYIIYVHGGLYRIKRTFVLNILDSKSTYKPYKNEHVVFSGDVVIKNFEVFKDKILKANLKNIKCSNVTQFFINDKRQILARFPNLDIRRPISSGFLYVKDSVDGGSRTKFKYSKDSVKEYWSDIKQGYIVIFSGRNYWNDIVPILKIDRKSRIIYLAKRTSYAILPGNRYFFQNIFEELDSPGEWYFDRKKKILYFWPVENIGSITASISMLNNLIVIKGGYNIKIEGFVIKNCNGTGIKIEDAKNVVIAKCKIFNAGKHGIEIKGGYANKVIGNDIFEVGGAGLTVSGGDRRKLIPGKHLVDNNYIHDVGKFYKNYSGIMCDGVGNKVSHNLVCYTPRIGISFEGNDHIIEYNIIHDTNMETQDSGIIYSCARDWSKRGNVIRFNYMYNSGGYGRRWPDDKWNSPFKTWGIYLDDWTSGTIVYGNIIINTCRAGFFIHGGRDNIIENNIIIEGGKAQLTLSTIPSTVKELPILFSRMEEAKRHYKYYQKYPSLFKVKNHSKLSEMAGNKFLRNIIYYKKPALLYEIYRDFNPKYNIFDYNVIFSKNSSLLIQWINPPLRFFKCGWKEWQKIGEDRHSTIADPLFEDLSNFKLSNSSPAIELGFKPIPFKKIGPYKSKLRVSWPINTK